MNRHLSFVFGVALLCGLGVGCGSNSPAADDTGAAGIGSFAGTGASGNGTSGTGGVFGTGQSGNGGTGQSGNGGTAGTGNSADCPATAPMDGDACTTASTQCTYDFQQCTCDTGNGAMAWSCEFGGATEQQCPATEPAAGTACTAGRGTCMIGANECDCMRDSNTWVCWDPTDCPATAPAADSACPTVGMRCEYGGGQGQGGGERCDCETTGWDCGGRGQNNDNDAGM